MSPAVMPCFIASAKRELIPRWRVPGYEPRLPEPFSGVLPDLSVAGCDTRKVDPLAPSGDPHRSEKARMPGRIEVEGRFPHNEAAASRQ
jgi:hypothetical protein